jgi:hypothetical protein
MIDMLVGLLGELGISDVEVRVNSIGGAPRGKSTARR